MNKNVRSGALAGLIASGPMALTMVALHKLLPPSQQSALPPEKITANLARDAHVDDQLDQQELKLLAWVNHAAYGSLLGSIYGFVVAKRSGPSLMNGVVYGLAVWAANYIGLLPALGLLRSSFKRPAPRTALIIVAHLVWGSILGALVEKSENKNE